MTSAAQLGWGRGWPDCPTNGIVVAVVGANGVRLPVRREIVPLVAGLILELEQARADEIDQYGSWGFACRSIAGTNRASNHSQGCAVDLEAPSNPHASQAVHAAPHPLRRWYSEPGRWLRSTMPIDAAAIARKWGFYWGGLYAKPDTMHFEVAVTPAQAARLIADLRALDGRPVPPQLVPDAPPEEEDPMHLPAQIVKAPDSPHWWVTDGITRQHVKNRAHAAVLISQDAARAEKGTGDLAKTGEIVPWEWPAEAIASIRLVGDAP